VILIKDVLASHKVWLESGGARGERAELGGAILQQADLHDANLERAVLSGARMSVADLMCANLKGADLRGADLWMSDLKDANLEGADLRGANLSEATNLTRVQLASAITDEETVLPSDLDEL
jgi:uncharacterized protein YjbI with pentapeptide repeats